MVKVLTASQACVVLMDTLEQERSKRCGDSLPASRGLTDLRREFLWIIQESILTQN